MRARRSAPTRGRERVDVVCLDAVDKHVVDVAHEVEVHGELALGPLVERAQLLGCGALRGSFVVYGGAENVARR